LDPLDVRYRLAPDAAARNIAGEAVVITPSDSRVHELDAVGTFLLESCDGTRTVREVARLLSEAFEVTLPVAERDTAAFLADLLSRGVLQVVVGAF
jgi:hypothetical protein